MTYQPDEDKCIEVGGDLDDKWFYLDKMRKEREALDAAIERAEAFFRQLMIDTKSEGVKFGGVQRLRLKQNATFAARKFTDDNPHLAATCMIQREALDTAAVKRLFPEIYNKYVGFKMDYPQPKQRR